MGYLYIDYSGREITRHSYSAGLDWRSSPIKYKQKRILGWREKMASAALAFGLAWEDSVRHYHTHSGHGMTEFFEETWAQHKDKPYKYTKQEISWESLLRAGKELCQLYAILQPRWPIPVEMEFQREFAKEVFPGHERLGGIEFYGKMDAIPVDDDLRPYILDYKTAGKEFEKEGARSSVQDDEQLRKYSWLTGHRNVAFVWAKKSGHALEKGSKVMVFAGDEYLLGESFIVAHVLRETGAVYVVKAQEDLDKMHVAQGRRESGDLDTRKEAVERKMTWLSENTPIVDIDNLTKQSLRFYSGTVSEQSALDAGRMIAKEIVDIAQAWDTQVFPNTFGVRYPHDDRSDPYYIAFVQGDLEFRDKMFEQKDDEFFDQEEPEPEVEGQ